MLVSFSSVCLRNIRRAETVEQASLTICRLIKNIIIETHIKQSEAKVRQLDTFGNANIIMFRQQLNLNWLMLCHPMINSYHA